MVVPLLVIFMVYHYGVMFKFEIKLVLWIIPIFFMYFCADDSTAYILSNFEKRGSVFEVDVFFLQCIVTDF